MFSEKKRSVIFSKKERLRIEDIKSFFNRSSGTAKRETRVKEAGKVSSSNMPRDSLMLNMISDNWVKMQNLQKNKVNAKKKPNKFFELCQKIMEEEAETDELESLEEERRTGVRFKDEEEEEVEEEGTQVALGDRQNNMRKTRGKRGTRSPSMCGKSLNAVDPSSTTIKISIFKDEEQTFDTSSKRGRKLLKSKKKKLLRRKSMAKREYIFLENLFEIFLKQDPIAKTVNKAWLYGLLVKNAKNSIKSCVERISRKINDEEFESLTFSFRKEAVSASMWKRSEKFVQVLLDEIPPVSLEFICSSGEISFTKRMFAISPLKYCEYLACKIYHYIVKVRSLLLEKKGTYGR